MTTYSKRRGRRSLAAILAAMLIASLLAVVAGSPAQAANTSSEDLYDHDNDAATAEVREFGGKDRYDTALRLATRFADAQGGVGSVSAAFLASGHSLVDAVSVSGLAGDIGAPVLLTHPDRLLGSVGDWLEDYDVGTVYVLGGEAAISDEAISSLKALVHAPEVNRIAGVDRYATAAAIASRLRGGASWCGSDAAGAVLVNGEGSLLHAVLVGPMAARLQLPVLLTAAGELPDATLDFIRSEDIEHVVIVGNETEVAEGVSQMLTDAGVDTVDRIDGDSDGDIAVKLTELAVGSCKDDLVEVNTNLVALVRGDLLVDGVTAAPVLAESYGDAGMVPLLVTGATLPASVRAYLASTPAEDKLGNKLHLEILAIGGPAAVSPEAMMQAIEAAGAADALTVRIGATSDTNGDKTIDENDLPKPTDASVILYFSDDVIGGAALDAIIRDIVEVNDVPARLATDPATHDTATETGCKPDRVTVTFESGLKAGDKISISQTSQNLGAGGDRRVLAARPVKVTSPPRDHTGPTINIDMIVGQTTADVTVTEADLPAAYRMLVHDPDDTDASEIRLKKGDTADLSIASANREITLTETSADSGMWTGTITFERALVKNDTVTITRRALLDGTGNPIHGSRVFIASVAPENPKVNAVEISKPTHSAQAKFEVPVTADDSGVTISAVKDGLADGAAGNDWEFVYDVASNWNPKKPVDIDVRVSVRDEVVSIRFVNGQATFGDLKSKLEGNALFADRFVLNLPRDTDADSETACGAETATTKLNDLAGVSRQTKAAAPTGNDLGETKINIRVRFNGYVATVDSSELLDDVLAEATERNDGTDVDTLIGLGSANDVTGPVKSVTYTATTNDDSKLPEAGDVVEIAAGTVATGYDNPATAAPTTGELGNVASGTRSPVIRETAAVKAPA